MLVMNCFLLMGMYFVLDNPAVLETSIEQDLKISASKYALFYTGYSYPNIIMPLIGGVFTDRIGQRTALLVFISLVTIGHGIFTIGGFMNSYAVMMTGRVIFGLGAESMTVAASAITSKWFLGKELNLAMGAKLALARLGAVAAGVIVPSVYDVSGLGPAFGVGFVICIFSFINAIGIIILDGHAEKAGNFPIQEESDKLEIRDILTFRAPFWMATASCMLTYMSVFPYNQVSSKLMQKKYSFSQSQGSRLYTIPYLISAVLTPLFGFIVDRCGKRVLFMLFSSCILVTAYSLSMTLPACDKCNNEMGPLMLSGIGYTVYAAVVWGSIPLTVPKNSVGTAFGLCMAVQNLGQSIAPSIVAAI